MSINFAEHAFQTLVFKMLLLCVGYNYMISLELSLGLKKLLKDMV